MKLLYLVTEDWFFASHFLPMGRAARDLGCEVVIATRIGYHKALLEAEGFRVVPILFRRRSLSALHNFLLIRELAHLYQSERPDIVHHISLKPVILGTLAAKLAGIRNVVNAITGWGYSTVATGWRGAILGKMVPAVVRLITLERNPGYRFIFENRDDAAMLLGPHLEQQQYRYLVVGGAGVNLEHFHSLTPPHRDTDITVGLVSRMLWSKGIDLAVAAVQQLRDEGLAVQLWLVGTTDPDNPQAFSRQQLGQWDATPGIRWLGYQEDVRETWREADIALLPSRGGEGLPRVLLEAAACARPLITTLVPGCRDFVEDGHNGLLVPPGDAPALARAIRYLALHPDVRQQMGLAARERIEASHSEAHIASCVGSLYCGLLKTGGSTAPTPANTGRPSAEVPSAARSGKPR
ncbi:MAG: glycosyltransferase family 4 protein [Gammaproteobacteria bacterium]|nr:glycosyltransferase family 4 protein [Gammaproteobacteria bacterium]